MVSTRLALRLGLGIFCGLVLVLVPAVFSSGTPTGLGPNPPSPLGYSTVRSSSSGNFTAGPAQGLYGIPGSGSPGLSFLAIILLIFLPSTVFSLFVRRWAEKKGRDYL